MKRTRYFCEENMFNTFVNRWSGNLFPMDGHEKKLSPAFILWVTIVYLTHAMYFATTLVGCFYSTDLTAEEMFKNMGPLGVVIFEFVTFSSHLHSKRKYLSDIIEKINCILIDSEELRNCVRQYVRPYKRGFTLFMFSCVFSSCSWAASTVPMIFLNNTFGYSDFAVAAYLPGAPFDRKTFAAGVLLQIIGTFFLVIGKAHIDIYASYLILLLTAQYKYVRLKMKEVLSQSEIEVDDKAVLRSLRQCIQHHCAVIEIGQNLVKTLALYIGMNYITCILKLCFLGFGILTFESDNIGKASFAVYAFGCLIQIFLIYSCIQALLDESTAVIDDAFHENWHSRGIPVKNVFSMMILSNKIECRLSAWRIVDLVRPTLAVILSKSYSVCLLLLEFK